ncbi:hypothetical protein ACN20G_30805 (plasmid) [Streptomyces sp. BI20]|uniref:hypothetical protein n=1 Tax=Streptomyces sp. BI20 TaxID=3403460 RepID=UPI003C7631E5
MTVPDAGARARAVAGRGLRIERAHGDGQAFGVLLAGRRRPQGRNHFGALPRADRAEQAGGAQADGDAVVAEGRQHLGTPAVGVVGLGERGAGVGVVLTGVS